jgi:hypothetical protein
MLNDKQPLEVPSEPDFIDTETLMPRVGVKSRRTINAWREHGLPYVKIPGSRMVKFHWPTVQQFLMRQQRGGEQ